MKFGLSGRLFESRSGYTVSLREFLALARDLGYDGVEIRYPQLPLETPAAQVAEAASWLKELNLSWSFGTVEGIIGDAAMARAVQMLNLHQQCGCQFTRFTVSQPAHIVWAQQFADEAARLGRRVIMQLHNGTLADTVPHALETLELIGRPNVGLAYEACHLVFAGSSQYAEAIRVLGKSIFCVSLQNYKAAIPADPPEARIMINGQAYVRAMPGDPDGIDFPAVFRVLRETGFDGFATVMTDVTPDLNREMVARRYLEMCRRG